MVASFFAVVAAAWYLRATRRLGRPWPAARTAGFVAGSATVAVAVLLPGDERFPIHVSQHLLIGMVGPALLALGAPLTLALQTCGPAVRGRLRGLVRSRPVAVVTHPVVAWALFGGSMFVLYLTPLYRLSVGHAWLHDAVHAHFLAVGALFMWAAVGVDPAPHRLPHGARLLMVAMAIPFHAVLGVALTGASAPTDGVATMADQRAGGGLLWAGGDLLGLLAALVVAAQWWAHEERQADYEDRAADATRAAHDFE